ncbi:MAG: hypothetical protein Q4G02_00970 [bacterium]|nr:hypothetical protein [bacterium]
MSETAVSPTKKFFQQGFINLFGSAFASFLAFLFNFIVVKSLSVANYGEYTSAVAYVAILATPLSILSLIVIKKVSSQPATERVAYAQKIMRQFLALLRKNWWLVFLVPIFWWWLSQKANFADAFSTPTVILLILASVLSTLYTAILQGWQLFHILSLLGIIIASVKLLLGGALLNWQPSLDLVYLTMLITGFGQIFLYFCAIEKRSQRYKIARQQTKTTLKIWPYLRRREILVPLISTISTTALINLDVIVVKMIANPDFAGEYGLYSLFAKILFYAGMPLVSVAFTFFNNPEEPQQQKKIFYFAGGLLSLFTLAMMIIYYFFPQILITIVGQVQYLGLSKVLWLAAIFGGLYCLVMLLSQYLVAKNRRLIYFSLLIPVLQAVGIYFYHGQAAEIMLVNIAVCLILLIAYTVGIIGKRNWRARKQNA